ncbi:MAG: histidinol-phosphate transaminase [Azoarcus sp.]|jgi:histidinol-phosphate aminotransferase|nr:histidinol-phosphate transaminase [Azoarcus sp.]
MNRYWSAVAHELLPYVPGEQPALDNLVKLNTNENPYAPSPKALAAIRDAAEGSLRLYPDPDAKALKAALASRYKVSPEQVFVGNGSDEVLAHAFIGLLKHEHPLWMPDVTYGFYPAYCRLYGIEYRQIPLDGDFALRPEDYLPRGEERAGAILFPNPNAPTGRLLPLADVERIVAANPQAAVLIDEAYIDFADEPDKASAIALAGRYPNLLVVHTFSKSRSLAGLRIGFAIGHPDLVAGLERIKNSFNSYPLDRLALAGAVASVKDEPWFQTNRRKVIASRAALTAQLRALGFEVLPSAANFIFVRHPAADAQELAAQLRECAILVRHFKAPRTAQFLRVTIGDDSQCAALIHALRDILGMAGQAKE